MVQRASSPGQGANDPEAAGRLRKRVLVVDADPRVAAHLSTGLRGTAEVRSALAVDEGIAALRWQPHLVLVAAELAGSAPLVDRVKMTRELQNTVVGLVADRWDMQTLAMHRARPRRPDRFFERPLDAEAFAAWLSGGPPPDGPAAPAPPAGTSGGSGGGGGAGGGRMEMLAREVDKLRKERDRHVRSLTDKDRKLQELKVRLAAESQVRVEMAQLKHQVASRDGDIRERDERIAQLITQLEAAKRLGQELFQRLKEYEG